MNIRLKTALEINGFSQKEFAERIHVSPQAVSQWVRGEKNPSYENCKLIYEVLGIDLIADTTRKQGDSKTMAVINGRDLKDIKNYDEAKKEAVLILDQIGIKENYSHAVYTLCLWLLSATIGLTHHYYVNKDEDEDYYYSDVFSFLTSYLEDIGPKATAVYDNYLEYEFFKMGGDLFESFDDQTIPDHDYCEDAMKDWYRFRETVLKSPASQVYCELRVAISEIGLVAEAL